MKITDILTLVKAGYTPTEIGNMERKEDVLQLLQGGAAKDDIDELLALAGEDPEQPDPEPEPDKKDPEPEEDYKQKYEELLKKQQLLNQRQPMGQQNKKTADEILSEIVSEYL